MFDVLEFFSLKDFIPLVLLIWLLHFVGYQMGGNSPRVMWWARGFAAASFLLYAGVGIDHWRPTRPLDFLALLVRALLAMGTAFGLARVLLPFLCFLYEHVWAPAKEQQRARAAAIEQEAREKEQQRETAEQHQAKQQRIEEQKRRREEEEANRPPPPTRDERIAAVQQRYESNLSLLATAGLDEIELKAAQEKAKQQYLRELDGLMQ